MNGRYTLGEIVCKVGISNWSSYYSDQTFWNEKGVRSFGSPFTGHGPEKAERRLFKKASQKVKKQKQTVMIG